MLITSGTIAKQEIYRHIEYSARHSEALALPQFAILVERIAMASIAIPEKWTTDLAGKVAIVTGW